LYHGFVIDDMFYSIRDNACSEAYYQKDLAMFQELLNSFRGLQARVICFLRRAAFFPFAVGPGGVGDSLLPMDRRRIPEGIT
jgi:hypothetical protein